MTAAYSATTGTASTSARATSGPVRVLASPGPALSVSVFRSDGAVLGGGSSDGTGTGIDLRTAPLAAPATIYVLVSSAATPSSPDVTGVYRLFVRLEGP